MHNINLQFEHIPILYTPLKFGIFNVCIQVEKYQHDEVKMIGTLEVLATAINWCPQSRS